MSIVCRPYQADCIRSVQEAWRTHPSVLAVLPTASGKSVIFSQLALGMMPMRSLVLVNRGELVTQAQRHLQRAGMTVGIEKAENSVGTGLFKKCDVVVATVQTLITKSGIATRKHKFDPKEFGLVICDEAHLFVAPSFKSIINYFKHGNPNIKILGVTATPNRADELALGEVFETCAFTYEIEAAIQDGWLVPVHPLCLRVEGMDISNCRTTAGDLNGKDLAAVMEAEKPLYGMAQATLEQVFGLEANQLHGVPVTEWREFLLGHQVLPRSALCFTVSVKQSEMLAAIFNRVVPDLARWVCGKTKEDDRKITVKDFTQGTLPILVNCGCFTTGFDVPRAEIIVPKPTKSHSLALQMYGRGFRPAEASGSSIVDQYLTPEERRVAINRSRKPRVTVIDLCGITGKHKLVTPFDILGGKHSPEVVQMALEKAREKMTPVNMTQEMMDAELEMKNRIEKSRLEEASRKNGLLGRTRFRVGTTNMFNRNDSGVVQMSAHKAPKQITEGMARVLRRGGYNPYSMSYNAAAQKMREIFGRWKKGKTNKMKP